MMTEERALGVFIALLLGGLALLIILCFGLLIPDVILKWRAL